MKHFAWLIPASAVYLALALGGCGPRCIRSHVGQCFHKGGLQYVVTANGKMAPVYLNDRWETCDICDLYEVEEPSK